jgi:hypothetical protein
MYLVWRIAGPGCCWLAAMADQPGMRKGIEFPFSLGNLLDDTGEQ